MNCRKLLASRSAAACELEKGLLDGTGFLSASHAAVFGFPASCRGNLQIVVITATPLADFHHSHINSPPFLNFSLFRGLWNA